MDSPPFTHAYAGRQLLAIVTLVYLSVPAAFAADTDVKSVEFKTNTQKTLNNKKDGKNPKEINLTPVRVAGKADIVDSMKVDPDKDRSAVGKPLVLTTTTNYQTLRDRQIDSIEDYARRVDAAVNYSSGNQSINIRGLDQSRIMTTIDGVRMPWANDGAYVGSYGSAQGGVTDFDFDSIGSIDIVKSADSSFFGTGALGGVVALHTLDPEDILQSGKTFGGVSKATYDGASTSAYLNQAVAARWRNTEVLLEGGYRNGSQIGNMGSIGGYGVTRTEKNPLHYTQGSFLGKIRHYFEGGHRLTLIGEWYDRQATEQTKTSEDSPTDRVTTNTENQRSRVSLNYDYQAESPSALFSEAHLVAYWQKIQTITDGRTYDSSEPTNPEGNFNEHLSLPVQSYGVTGSATANMYTGPLHHAITFGGEAFLTDTGEKETGYHANVTSALAAYIHDNYSDMPNIHGTDLGAIVQDRIGYGKNEWFHITPGFRFDYYRRDPHNSASYMNNQAYDLYGLPSASHGSHFSPKVLAEARITQDLTVYAQYSQAYRAPSATELYLDYNSYPSYAVVGDPNLKPETSRGWEVGTKYGTSERGFNISFYDNYYHNFIDTATLSSCPGGVAYSYGCYGYVNLRRVRIYGAEATFNWAFYKHWHTWESFSYSDGQNTDLHYHLASVAPFRGIIGIGYKAEQWGADLSGTFSGARHNVKYLTLEGGLDNQWNVPGYVLFDMTGWYRPSFYKPLRVQVGLYNMFNKTYYNAASLPYGQSATSLAMRYYTQPGRVVKVTAAINF